MITTAKIKGFFLEGKYRILKVFQYGAKTADECAPFGFDGNPPNDMDAIFLETGAGGEPVVIGYIQTQRLANQGEVRLYALNENNNLSTYLWLRKDQTIELGGNDENLVKFSKLQEDLTLLQTKLNQELAKIASGISTGGGVYVPESIVINIENAKTELIKIKGTPAV